MCIHFISFKFDNEEGTNQNLSLISSKQECYKFDQLEVIGVLGRFTRLEYALYNYGAYMCM